MSSNPQNWAQTIVGSDDPSVTPTPAPIATLYLRKSGGVGQLFQKVGAGDTAWVQVGSAAFPDITDTAGVQVDITAPTFIAAPGGAGAGEFTALNAMSGLGAGQATAYRVSDGVGDVGGFAAGFFRFEEALAASEFWGISVDAGATVNNQAIQKSFVVAEAAGAGGSFSGFAKAGALALVTGSHGLVPGYPFVLAFNAGPGPVTLLNEDAGSIAANRIICPGAVPLVVRAGGGWIMTYDSILSDRWRIIAAAL